MGKQMYNKFESHPCICEIKHYVCFTKISLNQLLAIKQML